MTAGFRLGPLGGRAPIACPEVEVASRRLPAVFDGFRIALLSDLHAGPFVRREYFQMVLQHLRRRRPDVVVMTGDMVEWSRAEPPYLVELLGRLVRSLPAYAVLGNHEYYGPVAEHVRRMRSAGVDVVINGRRLLGRNGRAPGSGRPAIALVGLDDLKEGRPDVAGAFAGLGAGTFTIVAAHNPDLADRLGPDRPVDLMLCGHTHGGQVRLLGWTPVTFTENRRYLAGLVRGPGFPLYISRGLGPTGIPLRLGAECELPFITLRRESSEREPGG